MGNIFKRYNVLNEAVGAILRVIVAENKNWPKYFKKN